jgi:putative tricarboxylic transport membrane protein
MRMALLIEVGVLIIAGIVSVSEGIRLSMVPKIQYDPLGSEFYCVGLGMILIILSVAYFFSEIRKNEGKGNKEANKDTLGREKGTYRIMMFSMIAVMVIYILLIDWIGYLVSSAVFFFLINRIAGNWPLLTNLAITAVMTLSYYMIFVKWMGMIFPRGVSINF